MLVWSTFMSYAQMSESTRQKWATDLQNFPRQQDLLETVDKCITGVTSHPRLAEIKTIIENDKYRKRPFVGAVAIVDCVVRHHLQENEALQWRSDVIREWYDSNESYEAFLASSFVCYSNLGQK